MKKIELPFCYIKEDDEAGGMSIEANGEIDGAEQYFSFSICGEIVNL